MLQGDKLPCVCNSQEEVAFKKKKKKVSSGKWKPSAVLGQQLVHHTKSELHGEQLSALTELCDFKKNTAHEN